LRVLSGLLQYPGIHQGLMAANYCYRTAKKTKSSDVLIVRW
jgi:hypothetical protein